MSNAVDILLIGGALDDVRICQPRPVPVVIEVTAPDGEAHDYTSYAYQGRYWVATASGEDITDEQVADAIAAVDWQPSWDLLRAQGEHP